MYKVHKRDVDDFSVNKIRWIQLLRLGKRSRPYSIRQGSAGDERRISAAAGNG